MLVVSNVNRLLALIYFSGEGTVTTEGLMELITLEDGVEIISRVKDT